MSAPARRAVRRWTWRLFAREWRQQTLIVLLIALALGATIVGAAAAVNAPSPDNIDVGNATSGVTFTPTGAGAAQVASVTAILHRPVDVIVNEGLNVPGLTSTFDLRSQDPHGRYGSALVRLTAGQYPTGPGQAAVSPPVASALGLRVGSTLTAGARHWRVVGLVEDPLSLLDAFALVAPGQVPRPSSVTVLFDGAVPHPTHLGLSNLIVLSRRSSNGTFGPGVIVDGAAALGLSLIGLVSIAGFTVIAQRRLRSLGLLRALGATDRNVRQVVRTNGALVGLAGTVLGALLGLAAWAAYRPRLVSSSHHVIALSALPAAPVLGALALALVTPVLASARPGRAVARLSVLDSLAARPAPPKNVTRSAIPGVAIGVIAVVLLGDAAASRSSSAGLVLFGLVALIIGVVLLSPTLVALIGRLGRRAPLAARLALRDLGRYRARSASTMSAVSIGVMIAMIVMLATTARYANVLDYVGPNMTANQLVVYTQARGPNPSVSSPASASAAAAAERQIADQLHATSQVGLYQTGATLLHDANGRNWSGQLYVATPALIRALHVSASSIDPGADILTVRPGLDSQSKMMLVYGKYFQPGKGGRGGGRPFDTGPTITAAACPPHECLANPVIQEVSGLPSGTSVPNTVITEHGLAAIGLAGQAGLAAWMITTASPITTAQVAAARQAAALAGMSVESKNEMPTSNQVSFWATLAAFAMALAVLAMSIGLIRAESAGDRRTLAATGARPSTLRTVTAWSAGAIALSGALLGALGAYVAGAAVFAKQPMTGSVIGDLTQVPAANLLAVFVGLPLVAALGGWLLAGREPSGLSRAPD